MNARDVIYRRLTHLPRYDFRDLSILGIANEAVEALEAAGYSILRDDETHAPTERRALERTATLAELEADRHIAYGLQGPKFQVATRIAAAIRALIKKGGEDD